MCVCRANVVDFLTFFCYRDDLYVILFAIPGLVIREASGSLSDGKHRYIPPKNYTTVTLTTVPSETAFTLLLVDISHLMSSTHL